MMTDKKRAFIAAYIADPRRNARRAAEVAGYGSARVMGPRLLHDPEVIAELERLGRAGEEPELPKSTAGAVCNEMATSVATEKQPVIPPVRRMVGECQLKGWEEEKKGCVGRQSLYSTEIGQEICYRIATSAKSLKRICDEEDNFPSFRTVMRWLTEHEEFCHLYARARELQGEYIVFEAMEIADDDSLDIGFKEGKDGEVKQFVDHEHIARSRLRVDHRKWLASKLAPRRFGDKLELSSGAGSNNPLADVLREIQEEDLPTIELSQRFKMIELNSTEGGEV